MMNSSNNSSEITNSSILNSTMNLSNCAQASSSFSDTLSLSNISTNNTSILSSSVNQLEMNIHPAFGNASSLSSSNLLHSSKMLSNSFEANVSGYGTISNSSSFNDKENMFSSGNELKRKEK